MIKEKINIFMSDKYFLNTKRFMYRIRFPGFLESKVVLEPGAPWEAENTGLKRAVKFELSFPITRYYNKEAIKLYFACHMLVKAFLNFPFFQEL